MSNTPKKLQVKINSIWGGISPSQYFFSQGQFQNSIGIDPDLPISDAAGDKRTSGVLRPSAYSSFDSTGLSGNPNWITTSPKTALIYVYANDGELISYSSAFASEAVIGTPTSGAGNGMAYYNNYLYMATPTDISRYGPLNGSASLVNNVWTGSTLGTQTALVSTTYPSIKGSGVYPNHPMHVHIDNKLYFGDFTNGIGYIHAIKTSKTTDEGDTNNGSAYNVLDLPFGFMPIDIESYGTDLVIAAIQSTNSTLNQGKAALFFWDTVSDSFHTMVFLPDPLVTALLNSNGRLYIWSGAITTGSGVSNGYRISIYLGGQTVKQVYYSNEGMSPMAGAVEAIGDRIYWGTFQQVNTATAASPTYYATVMALGSKDASIPSGAQSVIRANATGAAGDGVVTAIKAVQQASFSSPRLAVGWRDASNVGLDNQSTTYGTSVWHSQNFNFNSKGIVKRIRIPLGTAVGANMTITPKIFTDDFSGSSTTGLTVINSTNYANSERYVTYYPDTYFDHDFVLELTWSGTALISVLLPIEMDVELLGD